MRVGSTARRGERRASQSVRDVSTQDRGPLRQAGSAIVPCARRKAQSASRCLRALWKRRRQMCRADSSMLNQTPRAGCRAMAAASAGRQGSSLCRIPTLAFWWAAKSNWQNLGFGIATTLDCGLGVGATRSHRCCMTRPHRDSAPLGPPAGGRSKQWPVGTNE